MEWLKINKISHFCHLAEAASHSPVLSLLIAVVSKHYEVSDWVRWWASPSPEALRMKGPVWGLVSIHGPPGGELHGAMRELSGVLVMWVPFRRVYGEENWAHTSALLLPLETKEMQIFAVLPYGSVLKMSRCSFCGIKSHVSIARFRRMETPVEPRADTSAFIKPFYQIIFLIQKYWLLLCWNYIMNWLKLLI